MGVGWGMQGKNKWLNGEFAVKRGKKKERKESYKETVGVDFSMAASYNLQDKEARVELCREMRFTVSNHVFSMRCTFLASVLA